MSFCFIPKYDPRSRAGMKGSEHLNFHATDPNLGPALVSIKDVTTEEGGQLTLIILRLSIGTFQQVNKLTTKIII